MVILSIQIWTCMGKLPPISRLAIAGCYTQFTHDSPKVWTQSQEPLGSQIYLKSGTRESFCYHKTVLFIKSYEVIVKKKMLSHNPLFLHGMMQNVFDQAVCWFKSETVICSPCDESIPTGQFTYQTVTMLSLPSQNLRCCMITAVCLLQEWRSRCCVWNEGSFFIWAPGRWRKGSFCIFIKVGLDNHFARQQHSRYIRFLISWIWLVIIDNKHRFLL